MQEITNYTLLEFYQQPLELVEEYMIVLRYIHPLKTRRKLMSMKLKHVEMIKQSINSTDDASLVKIVAKVQKIKKEEVLGLKIIEFFGLVASVRDQLQTIVKAEEKGLTPEHPDEKWLMVEGAEKMAKFGIYNTLEALSGGDPLRYKDIMNMRYSEVFTVLLMKKTLADLQYKMSHIKTK